jgi:hypothetical protein
VHICDGSVGLILSFWGKLHVSWSSREGPLTACLRRRRADELSEDRPPHFFSISLLSTIGVGAKSHGREARRFSTCPPPATIYAGSTLVRKR